MTKASKGRRKALADEMLAGLQAFARDLQELPAEEIKAKCRQRTVEVDFRPRTFGAADIKQVRASMDCLLADSGMAWMSCPATMMMVLERHANGRLQK